MKKIFLVLLLFWICSCGGKHDSIKKETTQNSAAHPSIEKDAWWYYKHTQIVKNLNKDSQLVLLGDSIFDTLNNEDRKEVWTTYLDQYQTLNMGISGNRTENVLWRIENGTLEGINPKVLVLLIGSNNTDGNHYETISTADELTEGIWTICEKVKKKLPKTKIIVMGILPYGYKANHRNNINLAVNSRVSKFSKKEPNITYVDIGDIYKDKNGNVNKALMPDHLHPNAEGHLAMFKALDSTIKRLMNQ